MNRSREITAYHEAGHAVVGLAFGLTGRLRVSIKRRGKSAGRVSYDGLPLARDVLLFITVAGPFAQRRFAPRSHWLRSDDFAIAEKMIFGRQSKGTTATRKKYLAKIVDLTEQIVDYHWIDIGVAAKALLKDQTLTGDEITAAIRAARRKSGRRRRIGDPPAFATARR